MLRRGQGVAGRGVEIWEARRRFWKELAQALFHPSHLLSLLLPDSLTPPVPSYFSSLS